MRQKALLIGNGPNRLSPADHSWQRVLERLAEFSGQNSVLEGHSSKPFTLVFEEIALRSARTGGSEEDLKAQVATWMTAIEPNEIHAGLMKLGVAHLLTTNYDYSLELSTGHQANRVDLSSESRYSLFRCRQAGQTRVWHLHGEIDKPATITLGHDQYVGYLSKARNYLSNESTRPRATPFDYRSPVVHRRYDFETRPEPYSWIDVFLRDDVHIAGFSFDYSEVALWWLLGYKERLRLQDARLSKGIDVGNTWFYYFRDDVNSDRDRAHLDVLRDMGVRTVPIPHDGDYRRGWRRIIRSISQAA